MRIAAATAITTTPSTIPSTHSVDATIINDLLDRDSTPVRGAASTARARRDAQSP
jgi:hypothetical protein